MRASETRQSRFRAVRHPKARSTASRRLAKAPPRDYATGAEYNKPLLKGEHIREDRHEACRDRLKHYKDFVSETYKTQFCTPFVHPSENHNRLARLHR